MSYTHPANKWLPKRQVAPVTCIPHFCYLPLLRPFCRSYSYSSHDKPHEGGPGCSTCECSIRVCSQSMARVLHLYQYVFKICLFVYMCVYVSVCEREGERGEGEKDWEYVWLSWVSFFTMPMEFRREHWILWNLSDRWLWTLMLNLGSLEKHPVLSAAELSLQPLSIYLSFNGISKPSNTGMLWVPQPLSNSWLSPVYSGPSQ